MTNQVKAILAGILASLGIAIMLWQSIAHFDVDLRALGNIVAHALIPILVGMFYHFVRPDQRMSAMMFGIAFLMLLAPLCTILNYFAVTIAGASIDKYLMEADRMLGVSWPSLVISAGRHPQLLTAMSQAYVVSAFAVAIPLVLNGYNGDPKDISKQCFAVAIGAISTVIFWTVLPSFGAYTVYDLADLSRRAHVSIDTTYPNFLRQILSAGPGHINPADAHGLIGFPSFHTEELLIAVWYSRKRLIFFLPILAFSLLALISIPISGGHHIVDLLGGFAFAAIAIAAAAKLTDRLDAPVQNIGQLSQADVPAALQ
jgi:hypothetical protein